MKYRSNFIVANCHRATILAMTWHAACELKINYRNGERTAGMVSLPSYKESPPGIQIDDLSVEKLRSLISKRKQNSADFGVFRLHTINNLDIQKNDYETGNEDVKIFALKRKSASVFRVELPSDLRPERDVNHKIEVDEDAKPPHNSIFHLSSAERLATKEYVIDLTKKKIRSSISPYGVPLFL